MPELAISAEKVGFLIEKAREFDVKDVVSDPDSGSNGADDGMIDVLEDNGADPVVRDTTGRVVLICWGADAAAEAATWAERGYRVDVLDQRVLLP